MKSREVSGNSLGTNFRPTALLVFGMLVGIRVSGAQGADECLVCHGEPSLETVRHGRSVSLFVDSRTLKQSAHADLDCALCHAGIDPAELPHATPFPRVECRSCHDGERSEAYGRSIHGVLRKNGSPAVPCSGCHGTHDIQRVTDRAPEERMSFSQEMCGRCHRPEEKEFLASDHGKALAGGVTGAPGCIECHGEHDVSSPRADSALTNRSRQAQLCLDCHLDNPDVRNSVGPTAGFISSYETSVHGRAFKDGNLSAATCVDCHGSHSMKKGSDPTSRVARRNIPHVCGACHADEQRHYQESVHGEALARGITESPSCTDCHGEHRILPRSDPESPVAGNNVAAKVCSPCHASVRLSEKYGLASDRFRTYEDSFHGLAGKAGSVAVANCASCHGVHDIRPSSDPRSRTNSANLAATCGSCHPGANENFTKGKVHVIASSSDDDLLYLVSNTYIILIIVIVGGMAAHNILDFFRKSKRQLMFRRGLLIRKPAGDRLYLRMGLSERIQHAVLGISFTVLVITGFALRFPDAWWVRPIEDLSPFVFDLRGIMHRAAGVIMVLVGLYHVYYVLRVPRGQQLLSDLRPMRSDFADLIAAMKFNLGVSPERPLFRRFSYIEKLEYWALIWGSVVMAVTGMILWFPTTSGGLLTKLGWDVARTVHYYEAWLAMLSILVWHLYFVIFNPDLYPLNLSFWKGTLTEEEMEEEHPLELEEIQRLEAEEARENEARSVQEPLNGG